MEFKEYNNPEMVDYDIKSSLNYDSSTTNYNNKYYEQLFELIGILEDVTEEELMENYGISMQEYFKPSAETIKKVSEKLNSSENVRHR